MLNPTLNPYLAQQLTECLEQSIRDERADFGNIQFYNTFTNTLYIIAQKGFKYDFLEYFREVKPFDSSVCGRALGSGNPVMMCDVLLESYDASYVRTALDAGYRAVKSVPVLSQQGECLGMLSTHYKQPKFVWDNKPSPATSRLAELLLELRK